METIVAGPRDFFDKEKIFKALDEHHAIYPITTLIEGEARGVDTIAKLWAEGKGIYVRKCPADWNYFGKVAGPIRNKEMAELGERLCVIRNRPTGGTNDMIQAAKDKNLPINIYDV